MLILALDLATKTGWAVSCGQSGTWDLSIRRDESSDMRLIRLRGKLNDLHSALGIEMVAYEAARHAAPGMQGALVTQAEMQGVLKTWCSDRRIPYKGFSPGEIKKHATGKGNSGKDAMAEAARTKLGVDLAGKDDNEVDAIWLLDMAKHLYEDL